MAKVILHGPDYSTQVRTIRLCLAEKGIDYELEPVDILRGGNRKPEFLKLQPFGQVPVLVHDGFTLYETSAIARYVDEAFKGPKLQPSDKKDAARMNQLISIIEMHGYGPIISEIVTLRVREAFLHQKLDIEDLRKAAAPARQPVRTATHRARRSRAMARNRNPAAHGPAAPAPSWGWQGWRQLSPAP